MSPQEEIFSRPAGQYLPKKSRHVGTIGERIDIAVAVERVTSFTRLRFGSDWQRERVYIVIMRDDTGNAFVSKSPNFTPPQGTRLFLRCTIKQHSDWKGERQTVVFRIKERERA